MGYYSELDIELQEIEMELEFDWQAEQERDEQEICAEFYSASSEVELDAEELQQVENQAQIQDLIHNGYWE